MKRIIAFFLTLFISISGVFTVGVHGFGGNPIDDGIVRNFGENSPEFIEAVLAMERENWDDSFLAGTDSYQTKQLIVQTLDGSRLSDTYGAMRVAHNGYGLHFLQYESVAAAQEAEQAFLRDSNVQYAEPNRIFSGSAFPDGEIIELPPDYASGQSVQLPDRWGSQRIATDLFQQHLIANGATDRQIIVAALDTGVDASHPFLQGRISSNGWNYIENNMNVNDLNGHGTHVTGILVDSTPSNVKILPVRVLNENNTGSTIGINLGIRYAADNGASVINLSLGGVANSSVYQAAIDYAVSKGAIPVVAAGNESQDTKNVAPANCDNVITVSAIDQKDAFAYFSNFGDHIDIAAPGMNITSTIPGGKFQSWRGTSMAAPYVSGAVAMLRLDAPTASTEQIRRDLFDATVSMGGAGWNRQFGHGILDFNLFMGRIINPTSVTLSTNTISTTLGAVRDRFPVTATVMPQNATDKSVGFTSNNPSVAYYENGEIVIAGIGTAIITARTVNGIMSTCVVSVHDVADMLPLPSTPTLAVGDYIRMGTNSWGEEVVAQVTEVQGANRYRVWSVTSLGVADEFYVYRGVNSVGQRQKDYYWDLSVATQFFTPTFERIVTLRGLGNGWNDVNISSPRHSFSNWTLLDINAQSVSHYASIFASDLSEDWSMREMGTDPFSDSRPSRSNIRLFADVDLSDSTLSFIGAGTANNPYRMRTVSGSGSGLSVSAANSHLGTVTYGASREELRALTQTITFDGGLNIEIDKSRTSLTGDSDAFILNMGSATYPFEGWSIAPRDYFRFDAGDVPYTASINVVDTTGRVSRLFVTLKVNRRQLSWKPGNNIEAYKEYDGNRSSGNARINDISYQLDNVAHDEYSNLRITMGTFQFATSAIHSGQQLVDIQGFVIEDVGIGRNYIAPTTQPTGIGTIYAKGQDPNAPTSPGNSGGGGGGGGGGSGGADPTPTPQPTPIPTPTPEPDVVTQNAVNFGDIREYTWAENEINFLAERGIIRGRSDTAFAPADNIIRADYMVLMMRMLEIEGGNTASFIDVDSGMYYAGAISAAKELGFTYGFENGEFRPTFNISRQDMFAMTYRIMQMTGEIEQADLSYISGFDDYNDIADYAKEAMAALAREGLVRGTGGMVNPRGNATRAETAVFVYRVGQFLATFD